MESLLGGTVTGDSVSPAALADGAAVFAVVTGIKDEDAEEEEEGGVVLIVAVRVGAIVVGTAVASVTSVAAVGFSVGTDEVGSRLAATVGVAVGSKVGSFVGRKVGSEVGETVGVTEGSHDGCGDGSWLGSLEGE